MELLKERILKDGRVAPGGVLKVDNFLNHQIDVKLYNEMGKEFKKLFSDVKVDRILTIEASGIGIACIAAQYFDVPVVFAKKAKSKNIDGDVFTSTVESFTYGKSYDITVSKKFINESENVLIIDDFLANGKASLGLLSGLGYGPKPCHVNMGMSDTADNAFRFSAELLIKFFFQIFSGCFNTAVIFFRIYFPKIQTKKCLVQTIPNLDIIIGFLSQF